MQKHRTKSFSLESSAIKDSNRMVPSQKSSINVDQSEIQPKIKLQIKDLVLLPESSDDNNTPMNSTNLQDLIKKLNPDSADVSPIIEEAKNNSTAEYKNDRLKNMKIGWNTFIDNETIKENEDNSERLTSNSPETSNTGLRGGIDHTPDFSQMTLVIPQNYPQVVA